MICGLSKGDYKEILDAAETDGRREDYLKIETLDEYAHVEILNTLRNYYPNLLSLVGKQLHNAETSLSVERHQVFNLRYHDDVLPGIYGEEPSETQMEWFRKAVEFEQKRR